jgi:RHH-type proline utilization regulon transcriptional repressor/proline dehydrogenase/delta 1-pyrroline-5-carboxylate dehydrogenase
MATTTLGVKLDDASRERLKRVAQSIDRTPHWLIKQAIFTYLDQVERGQLPNDVKSDANGPAADGLPSAAAAVSDVHDGEDAVVQPFLEFAQSVQPQSVLRAAITAAYRRPETEAIPMLLEQARLPGALASEAKQLAHNLAGKLRTQKVGTGREGLVQGLIQEFSLSSQEGVALMCLAEALLRIPDKATRDALIRDKISNGNWQSHLGQSPSLFVNAATWGLLLTGKLVATHNEAGLSKALSSSPARPFPKHWPTRASTRPKASAIPTTCSARPP